MRRLGEAEMDEVGYDTTWDKNGLDAIRYAWRRSYRRPRERIGWVGGEMLLVWFVFILYPV